MKTPNQIELYNEGRERWMHEDELINQRLIWLLTSQSLLFAGYGFLLQLDKSPLPQQAKYFATLVPLTGLLLSVVLMVSVIAAVLEILRLHKKYRGLGVELHDIEAPLILGLVTPLLLPLIFVVAWSLVAGHVGLH
jgi:hypothetical protein